MIMGKNSKDNKMKNSRTKDKVLQARIPEDLDEELRGRSAQLGVSVSGLVRNILMNTFNLIEDVVSDSVKISRASAQGANNRTASSALAVDSGYPADDDRVVAWQEVLLNINAVCEQCNALLPRGSRAAVALPVAKTQTVRCMDCLQTTLNRNEPEPGTPGD